MTIHHLQHMLNILLLTFLYNSTIGQAGSNILMVRSKYEKLDDLISTYADYEQFNGSILVSEKGEVIYKKSFGLANQEWQIPNQPDTKFRLASITKQFTAMLIMQLVEEKLLDLKTPVSTYLTDYPENTGDIISIHHLLTHTSGIPNYTSFPNYREIMRKNNSPTDLLTNFYDLPLNFTPGERFEYSNSGYAMLGAIIEKVTGKTYGEVLQDKILQPLKMFNTGFDDHHKVISNRASGYYKSGSIYNNAGFIDMSAAYSAGGMYSTVEDLFLWDQALYTEKLLSKKYMDLIFNPYISAWDMDYGYGWMVGESTIGNTKDKIMTANHDGVINGFTSMIYRIPSDKSGIIILDNTGSNNLRDMTKAITGILYNKSYDLPKKSIANLLMGIIKKDGLSKGLEWYQQVKVRNDYYLDENELNLVGYEFLQSQKITEALSVFKLNIDTFPHSSNVYDSYGEALMIQGNKAEAIDNYKKSLKLNPNNDNAIVMLKKLGLDHDPRSKIEQKNEPVLSTPFNWKSEIITFPIGFAPDIDFKGYEDIRFAPEWAKSGSDEFWTYAFAWYIEKKEVMTVDNLTHTFNSYYDGLMEINKNKNQNTSNSLPLQKTKSTFVKTKDGFDGDIKVYDKFFSKDYMVLNIKVKEIFCPIINKQILLSTISPKRYDHQVWKKFEDIKIIIPCE